MCVLGSVPSCVSLSRILAPWALALLQDFECLSKGKSRQHDSKAQNLIYTLLSILIMNQSAVGGFCDHIA